MIATGLRWKRPRDPLTIIGTIDAAAREACGELGAATAASLAIWRLREDLFVHGVGWQRPGATLRSAAPPLARALRSLAAENHAMVAAGTPPAMTI